MALDQQAEVKEVHFAPQCMYINITSAFSWNHRSGHSVSLVGQLILSF